MKTKVEVQKANSKTAVDVHEVEDEPQAITNQINGAIKAKRKFVTLKVPTDKTISVIAENVISIWQE